MTPWLLVAVGGALGALSRYAVDRAFAALLGYPTAISTFSINIIGAFLLGVFVSVSAGYSQPTLGVRLFLATGFLASYTTFSTLAVSTAQLAESGDGISGGHFFTSSMFFVRPSMAAPADEFKFVRPDQSGHA